MKRYVKRLLNILLVINIIMISFFDLTQVTAKTVNDLEKELDQLLAEAQDTKNQLKYTVEQINKAKNDITNINKEMVNISKEIENKTNEIAQLNENIKAKDAETKELMEFVQISSGGSFYLDYVMGADTLTDFIYRASITEQLLDYNNQLIIQMNDMIKANEQAKIDLNNKTIELANKQEELSKNLKVLASQKIKLDEYDRSLEDEIAVARDVLQMYRDAGCGKYEDLNACAARLLPADSGFKRPLTKGYVTSEYGSRTYYLNGKLVSDVHYAIDVSNSGTTNVYPVANGKVAKVFYDSKGGNQVVIHHKIISGGVTKYYSSTYCHLASVNVRDGTVLTKDMPIGIMGATGSATGPHVHLAISNGLRYKDYVSYNDYIAHSFNPRNVINFPSGTYRTWYDRTTRY